MSTGTAIIEDALKLLGVNSVLSPAAPENITDGMNVLNSMLEDWLSKGIHIGFTPLEVPGDELNEPQDATNAIKSNLAIEMSPYFDNGGNIVSPALAGRAKRQMADIKILYEVFHIPPKVISSTTPLGAGNRRGVNNLQYFPKGMVIDG